MTPVLSDEQPIDELREAFAAEASTIEPATDVWQASSASCGTQRAAGVGGTGLAGAAVGTGDHNPIARGRIETGSGANDRRPSMLLPAGRLALWASVLVVIVVVALVSRPVDSAAANR